MYKPLLNRIPLKKWQTSARFAGVALLLAFQVFDSYGQASSGNLAQLVGTERQFAQLAFETDIRTAFLTYLDSSGTLFSDGRPINGIEAYKNAPANKTELLSWYPMLAFVARAGDLGFTSGPHQYFADRQKGPVSSGYFLSVWRRNGNGDFKLVIDGGVPGNNPAMAFQNNPKPENEDLAFLKTAQVNPADNLTPWKSEDAFIKAAGENPVEAYTRFMGDTCLFLRNRQQAGKSRQQNLALISADPLQIYQFRRTEKGISKDRDLAYSYGAATLSVHGQEPKHGFYVRLWQFQQSGWKIVAEEISL